MARRNTKLNWFDKLWLGCVLLLMVVAAVGGIVVLIGQAIEDDFHSRYQSVVDSYFADGSKVTGNKAVSQISEASSENIKHYSRSYVPEELLAEKPEEVRYVIRCIKGSSVVGYYSGGGVGKQPWVELEILDLKTGKVLGETKIYGGDPPKTVSVKPGQTVNKSGSAPSASEVKAWVKSVLDLREDV